jgi:hypothetical protein
VFAGSLYLGGSQMRRVWVSPKVVLVKVLFCNSPMTVDLQSAAVWVATGDCAPHGVPIAKANKQIAPHDLIGMDALSQP